jgi:hypothetical protein
MAAETASAGTITVPQSRGIGGFLGREGLLVLVVAVASCVPLFRDIAVGVTQDTWLALVAGRDILDHGLPMHNTWTVEAAGHHWVDQQWLGQAVFAELFRVGGLRLVLLVCGVANLLALGAAAAAARRAGASARVTAFVAVIAFASVSANPRVQTLVFPLFVLLVVLISRDSRAPSRRVLLTLPLLALWANVHGSVILAAGLVSLYGLILLLRRGRPATASALVLVPWACTLASPYAAGLPGYYKLMLTTSPLQAFVVEWQPTHLRLVTLPFFALLALAVYLAGRARGALTLAEGVLLVATGVAGLLVIRNMVWFSLAAACLLPPLLGRVLADREAKDGFNRLLGLCGIVIAIAVFGAVAARSDAGLKPYPSAGAAAAANAAGTNGKVYATLKYGDWLLWEQPQLAGRVAYDARVELLTTPQIANIADVAGGRVSPDIYRDNRVFVVSTAEPDALAALRACTLRIVYARDGAVVLADVKPSCRR